MNNREFYEYIFRGGGKQIVTTLPDGVNRQFSTTDLDAAYEYVVEKGKRENVYLNPNPRREDLPLGVRGSDDDIIMVNAFVADVDVLGESIMIQHDSPLFVMQFCLYNKSADLLIHYLIATCDVEKFQVELIAFLDA